MKKLKLRYNKAIQKWVLLCGDREMQVSRVIIDLPARSVGNQLEFCIGSTDDVSGDVLEMRIGARVTTPGKLKPHEMRSWCCTFDENTNSWFLWRPDNPAAQVTTKNLTIECHAITNRGELHCLAEMLVDGATNRDGSFDNAQSVRLRPLAVLNQAVDVPIIARASGRATL